MIPNPMKTPVTVLLKLRNQPPGTAIAYPAKEIVDAGFLELVRYGIRKPGDPLIEDSLRVVDAILKVNTPFGPGWQSVQPRRLRAAGRWRAIPGLGVRPRLALAYRGAGAL